MSPPFSQAPFARPQAPSAPCAEGDADASEFAQFLATQDPVDAAAAAWMVRRQDGLTPGEQAQFQQWLAASPEHVQALEQMESVWARLGELPRESVQALQTECAPQPAHAHRRWVAGQGPAKQTCQGDRRAWLQRLARFVPRAAAIVMALGVAGGAWYGWGEWRQLPVFEQSLATARGELRQLTLPDGSTLWLDTATRAEAVLYRHRRQVRLIEGQVLFAVPSGSGQVFEVLAGHTRVTVVGTRFSVRRTRSGLGDGDGVRVVVEEGRVRVSSSAGTRDMASAGASVELSAGQSVTADSAGVLETVRDSPVSASAWREGRVNFNGTPLAQALAEFERYGDTGLVIRDPAVAALKVNGSFDVRQVGSFAKALPKVLPVRLRVRNGQTEILAAGGG